MLILKDILEYQKPGVRQNPYFYKIVLILDIFNHRDDENYSNKLRKGLRFNKIEDIPKKYHDREVHNIEPDIGSDGELYLKIVLI